MNGYLLVLLTLPVIALVFLLTAYIVAKVTEWEVRRWREKFIRERGRDPRPDEYPETPSMYP